MRGLFALAPLALLSGCLDFGALGKSFCATAGVARCDDFENDGASPTWQPVMTGGSIGRTVPTGDPDGAFRGKQSLRLDVPVGGQAQLEDVATTPSLAHDLFVRAFVYFPLAPPDGDLALVAVRDGAGAPLAQLRFENAAARLVAADGREAGAPVALTGDQWLCLEVGLIRDAVPRVELYVDAADDTTGADAQITQVDLTGAAATRIGVDRSGATATQASTVWMDDVIIDGTRIGCAK